VRALAARLRPAWVFPARLLPRRRPSFSLSARMRRHLSLALATIALLVGLYFFWIRDIGFVKVDRVSVSGLTGKEAPGVRAALERAAAQMTTLHVETDKLERAVAAFPSVARIEATPDFPGTLRITVVERVAAAVVAPAQGKPVTVATDGTVLGPPSKGLPSLPLRGAIASKRVSAPGMLRLLAVSGAAPAGLRGEIESIAQTRDHGIVVKLGEGVPELRFGDERRARAKWAAASALLADPEVSDGAYIDLRLPERPAVGGLTPKALPVKPGAEGAAPEETAPVVPEQAVPEQALPEQAPPVVPEGQAPPTPAPIDPVQ